MKALENKIQEACKVIADLLDVMPFDIEGESITDAERFYRLNYIIPPKVNTTSDDELPF